MSSHNGEGFFELSILGSSGGILDGKTCSFLLKPSLISYKQLIDENIKDCTLAIDAGSGISALIDIFNNINRPENRHQLISNPNSLVKSNYLLDLYQNSKPIEYYSSIANTKNTFSEFIVDGDDKRLNVLKLSSKLIDTISSYLITHAHLDHISGLVINSPHFPNASFDKSNSSKPKKIYGTSSTVQILRDHIFNGKVWPDLSNDKCGKQLEYHELSLQDNDDEWQSLNRFFKVKMYNISHGVSILQNDKLEVYQSTAYLFGSNLTNEKLLMFGDVEPDKNSLNPKNWMVWSNITPYIISKELKSMVIECSSINSPKNVNLFGHMNPNYLICELRTLRRLCILHHTQQFDKLEALKSRYENKTLKYTDDLNNSNVTADDHFHDSPASSRNQSIVSLTEDSDLYDLTEDPYTNSSYQPLKDLNVIIIHIKENLSTLSIVDCPNGNEEDEGPFDPRHKVLDQLNYLNEYYNLGISFTVALPGLSYCL